MSTPSFDGTESVFSGYSKHRSNPRFASFLTAFHSSEEIKLAVAKFASRVGMPQRLPDLQWRASEFGDPGYAVSDVSGLTGQQRYANVRFDDEGRIFNIDPNAITDELRSMLNVQGATDFRQIDAYMLWSALQRGAVAPMWEVRTARLQQNAGDPNAGLTEEERAARAGQAAGADTAYASSQSQIPEAANQTRWRTAA